MIGFIIISRLGSNRLPEKHLLEIGKKSVVEHFINRIIYNFEPEKFKVVLATTNELVDQKFNYLKKKFPILIYNGSSNNIPLRIYKSMIYSKICKVVIIEGDDLLFSISAVKSVISKLQSGYNYVMSRSSIGMNIYGMTKNF